MVPPAQTDERPEIAAGELATDTTMVLLQPAGSVNVIVVVPEVTPVSTPVDKPIVATDVLLLDHVPAKPVV
jgi:hypothetical protein